MDAATQSKISRLRAWLLIVIGSGLSLGITLIAAYLGWTIAQNDQAGGTHWTGSHEMTVKVFELFAAVFVFGLVAIGGGILQLRNGRPSWAALALLLGLVMVMYFLGQGIMRTSR